MNITFILVRPRIPGNIGSTARALKNMGSSKLVLVDPAVPPTHPESLRLAVNAADILKKAKVCKTIEEAARGIRFLVGTSRRIGKYRRDFVPLPELPSRLPPRQKTGILFGSEERGLTNRELAHCHLVCTIPASPNYPSLNLAQAVMVTAYQLRCNSPLPPLKLRGGEGELLAPVNQIEAMYQHLERTLSAIGFFPHKNSFHMMRTLRQLFARTGMTEREVRIIRGICRQVLWASGREKDFE